MARWYRAYEGTVTDPKLAEAALIAGAPRSVVIATWHAVLEACASANAGGDFDLPARRVAVLLVEPISLIEQVFSALSELGLIAGNTVVRWRDRQYESDSSAARTRAWRERNKASQPVTKRQGDVTVTPCDVTVTASDAVVTPPETDTDTETDISTNVEMSEVGISVASRASVDVAVRAWNDMAGRIGLAQVQRITEPRRRALKARLVECDGIDGWYAALGKVEASPFLTGQNDRGWRADFDFVVRESSFTKIMEGKYDRTDQKSAAQRAFEGLCGENAGDAGSPFQSFSFGKV